MLSEAPKKQKLKMKAAKVLKFLLNILPVRSKRKQGEKEKLYVNSFVPNSYANDVDTTHEFNNPLIQTENISCRNHVDRGLSLSWSYLVHEPFSFNLEECEDIDGGEIFYNECYFEDDYWQDFHEHDIPIKSPSILFGNESFCRLFEPERTNFGEFKRSMPGTPCRRYASLPNLVMKETPASNILPPNLKEADSFSEELLDYNKSVFNSQFGLHIAFDNVLDESCVCNDQFYSNTSELQFTVDRMSAEHLTECKTASKIMECMKKNSKKPMLSSPRTSFFDKQSTNRTASESTDIIDQISDKSDLSSFSSDDCLGCAFQTFSGCCKLDSNIPSLQHGKPASDASKEISHCSLNLTTKRSIRSSLESGYTSCDNANLDAVTNHILDEYSVEKSTKLDPFTGAVRLDLEKYATNLENKCVKQNTPSKLLVEASTHSTKIQFAATPSSSSPVCFQDTSSHTHKFFKFIPNLSPIGQKSEVLKSKFRAQNYVESLKRKRQEHRGFLLNISLRPKLNLVSGKDPELCSEEYTMLSRSADLILNRIGFKEELSPYINLSEMIEYLSSYFMVEILKLSNKTVQTIIDYKKIMQESVDIFNSERLTQRNCFCEMLKAVLLNRPRIVSECEDFIFENLHSIVNRQDHTEAPVLIFLLLCNSCFVRHDPLYFNESESESKTFIVNFLEACQADFESYSKMKKIFSVLFDRTAEIQLDHPPGDISTASYGFYNVESETKMKANKTNIEYLKRISGYSNSDLSNVISSTNGVKCACRVSILEAAKIHQSNLEESTFSFKSKQKYRNWNKSPVISTMV